MLADKRLDITAMRPEIAAQPKSPSTGPAPVMASLWLDPSDERLEDAGQQAAGALQRADLVTESVLAGAHLARPERIDERAHWPR